MRPIDADKLVESLRESVGEAIRWCDESKDEDTRARAESAFITFIEAILRTKSMPTIYSEQKEMWIPCEERLPKENEKVLVTRRIAEGYWVDIAEMFIGDWCSYADDCLSREELGEVVAWMPLPEPYKEEKCDTKSMN